MSGVRGYPELYYSRLVVLGEGPSEEIVLRRFFEASGAPLDGAFVSVVPLGGRHVNHFWRLLDGLEIPYLTMLDLDLEKEGAGWGRIQYVRNQLVKLHGLEGERLQFKGEKDEQHSLADTAYDGLGAKDDRHDTAAMEAWLQFFRRKFQVFFTAPLDIDLAMLESFFDVYTSQAPEGGGPRIPDTDPERGETFKRRMRQVLSSDIDKAPVELGATYSEAQVELFAWYKYLFIDGSKPVAHTDVPTGGGKP